VQFMELEPKLMQQFAWEMFHLTEKLRHMGYDITTDKARNKGQYTIREIAASGDHRALRSDTNEFDDQKFRNALFVSAEVKDAVKNLLISLEWWEAKLVEASGQERFTRKK
jgi:hypothetical protein